MYDNASNTDEEQHQIGDDIRYAFDDVEEFGRGNSPAVKRLLRGINAEPEVVVGCDPERDDDNPFVYIRVFDAGDYGSAAVVMEFQHKEDAVYVGQVSDVYSALHELAGNEYCWTVKDSHSIAETYIEDNHAE